MIWLIAMALSFFHGMHPNLHLEGNCRASNDWSTNELAYLQKIVTGTDLGNTKLRAAFKLPYITTTPAVTLVSDDAVCGAAATALESFLADSLSHRPVFVFQVGSTRFAIADGSLEPHIFDNNFNYLLTLGELD